MKKKYYQEEEYDDFYFENENQKSTFISTEPEFGCGFCWDKRKNKSKELYFLDAANNMRVCTYCPSCGRKFDEV